MGEEFRPPEGEVLQFGPGPPRRRRSRWPVVALCCLVVAGAAGLWLQGRRGGSPESAPTPTVETPSLIPPWADRTQSPRSESDVDLSFLHAESAYALFVRSDSDLYRAQPRSGRLIRTTLPHGRRGGRPAAIVPVVSGAVLRGEGSLDIIAVPDDGLPVPFRRGGAVLPGPDPAHVWVEQDGRLLARVDPSAIPTGPVIGLPEDNEGPIHPDGQGYALVRTPKGVYDLRPGSTRLVTTAGVLAAGPDRMLVRRCPDFAKPDSGKAHSGKAGDCRIVLLDGGLHSIRTIGRLEWLGGSGLPHGVISPDHRTVAMSQGNENAVLLIDLITGNIRDLHLHTTWWAIFSPGSVLAFSPDSRWLFVIDSDQHVVAVDVASGTTRRILPDTFPAQQLAIRP